MIAANEPAIDAAWEYIAGVDPRTTFFQTPAWARLVEAMGVGWSNASRLITLRDGSRAVVPRMRLAAGHGCFARLDSMPPGVYGGPVCERPLREEEARLFGRFFRGLSFAGGTLIEAPSAPLAVGSTERIPGHTQILDLPPGGATEDGVLRGYSKGHRAAVGRARREQVRTALARDQADFTAYGNLYQDLRARWRRAPYVVYPHDFFAALWRASGIDSRIRLWLAKRDEQLLAGAVILHHGCHAAYWHAASSAEGRALQAGHLVLHTAIMDALQSSRMCFDFMPSAGLDAVARFKRGFGAQPVEIGIHEFGASIPYRVLSATAARLSRTRPAA
jgi:hypothetical protein